MATFNPKICDVALADESQREDEPQRDDELLTLLAQLVAALTDLRDAANRMRLAIDTAPGPVLHHGDVIPVMLALRSADQALAAAQEVSASCGKEAEHECC
jgi:hypothetical protein